MHALRTHILRLTPCVLFALLAIAPAAGASAATEAASVGFGVAPLRFDIDAVPGRTTMHPITITNTDRVATRYTFDKVDFQGDKDEPAATPVLLGGKLASGISGYDWLGLPEAVTIPPGESRTVDVRVSAPNGATGGHYAAVIVRSEARSAGAVLAQSGIGVLFLMNAGGVSPPEVVITETQVVGATRTVTKFINPGKTETTPKASINYEDPILHHNLGRVPGKCSTAMPGGSGTCEFPVGSKPGNTIADSGSGFVKPSVEVGDPGAARGDRARGELPTEWAGSWSSMLLPLVGVALFLLYFLFLRRRRQDSGERDDLEGPALDGPSFT